MPPSAEGVRVVAELVTDAAIDAASERVNRGPLNEDPLIPALNAAAPHIAAEALRQAASEFVGKFCNDACDLDTCDWAIARGKLLRLADELERE